MDVELPKLKKISEISLESPPLIKEIIEGNLKIKNFGEGIFYFQLKPQLRMECKLNSLQQDSLVQKQNY